MIRTIHNQGYKSIAPILFIVVVTIIGYSKLFNGADFFVHQDQLIISNYSAGNSIGNGWRPDKGFGMPFYYGDSLWHPWSFFSFWDGLFPSPAMAYSVFVVLISILGGISSYYLLRKAVPEAGRSICMLCPLIVFAPHMAGIHYLRCGMLTAALPISMLILYNYYQKEKLDFLNIIGFGLILWASFVLGSTLVLSSVLSFGFIFSLTHFFYYRKSVGRFVIKTILLYVLAVGLFSLLAFWLFYTSFVELSITEYARAKVTTSINLSLRPNLGTIIETVFGIFQIDWFPNDIKVPGVPDFIHRAYNVMAIFPLILFFFLFHKSKNFWEYSFKILSVIFVVHLALRAFPVYHGAIGVIASKSKQLVAMYSTPYICHIGLIAMFLYSYDKNEIEIKYQWAGWIQKGMATVLILLYFGLSVFSFITLLSPEFIPGLFVQVANVAYGDIDSNYSLVAAYNILRYIGQEFKWPTLPFYLLNALLLTFFLKKKWLNIFVEKSGMVAFLILLSAIFMGWAVYPMNLKKTPWEEVKNDLPYFKPFDRFYYMGASNDLYPKNFESYEKQNEIHGGPIKFLEAYTKYGYAISPYLDLHGHRSFTTKLEKQFLMSIFNGDGEVRLPSIRNLARGPMITSELLDMGAVSYYYSRNRIENPPPSLSLLFESKWLYIYKNLNAWPYFYLATKLQADSENQLPKNVEQGSAYLDRKNLFQLARGKKESKLKLKDFSFGEFIFEFDGEREELLVIADAWHPFWKAASRNKEFQVIRVNGIFKGIRLKPGNYDFKVYFDTSAYKPGVYISAVTWLLFLFVALWLFSKHRFRQ